LKADNKVRTICKIVKSEPGKHFTIEENPSVKVNSSVTNGPKLVANLFNTYFITTVEKQQWYKELNKGRGNAIHDQNIP
jgi:hypothetical protein